MTTDANDDETLMKRTEVASLFGVDPKTVTRWAQDGLLTCVKTLGGHRRYKQSEVQALLAKLSTH